MLKEGHDAFTGGPGSTHGFAVAAETVVTGILYDTGTDRVEVDVGGNGQKRAATAYEYALVPLFPERAFAPVAAVVRLGIALLEKGGVAKNSAGQLRRVVSARWWPVPNGA
jgi:hypothetical protein